MTLSTKLSTSRFCRLLSPAHRTIFRSTLLLGVLFCSFTIASGQVSSTGSDKIKSTQGDALITPSSGSSTSIEGGNFHIGTMMGGSIGRLGFWNTHDAGFTQNTAIVQARSRTESGADLGEYDQKANINDSNGGLLGLGQNSNTISRARILNVGKASSLKQNRTIKVDKTSG